MAEEYTSGKPDSNPTQTLSKLLNTASHLDVYNYAGAIPAVGLGVVVNIPRKRKPSWTNKIIKFMEKTTDVLFNATSFSGYASLMSELAQFIIDAINNLLDLLSISDDTGRNNIPNSRLISPNTMHKLTDSILNPNIAVGLRAKKLAAKALINQATRTSRFNRFKIDSLCDSPGTCACRSLSISILLTIPKSSSYPLRRGPDRNTLVRPQDPTHYYLADLNHPSNIMIHSNQHGSDIIILSHPITRIKVGTQALLIRSNQIFLKNNIVTPIRSKCYSRNGTVNINEEPLLTGSIILEDYCKITSSDSIISKPSLPYNHINHENSLTWDKLVFIDYSLSTAIADYNSSILIPVKKIISDEDLLYLRTQINEARDDERDFRDKLDSSLHRSFLDKFIDSAKQTAVALLILTISALAAVILTRTCIITACHTRCPFTLSCLRSQKDNAILDLQTSMNSLSSIVKGSPVPE